MRDSLGHNYVDSLFEAYSNSVPQEADLVTYWVAKAWDALSLARSERVGLVTTNSIRGGANRRVLSDIADASGLFEAWSDQPWAVDGAAVRVSIVAFGNAISATPRLDGHPVGRINADLTGVAADLTKAVALSQNSSIAFQGGTKAGSFDVDASIAREWLKLPVNPNGRPNADVLRPWVNAIDVTRRHGDQWIVDFGWAMSQGEAALYEAPFRHVLEVVEPVRRTNRRENYAKFWWRFAEARPGMWRALETKSRFILTPLVSKYRVFVWPSNQPGPPTS